MKLFLPSFGAHVPGVDPQPDRLTTALPPLVAVKGGLDLDYSPLLLAHKVIVDRAALDRLDESDTPALRPIRKSMSMLENEGRLQLEDYSAIAAQHSSMIDDAISRDLEFPQRWLGDLQHNLSRWSSAQEDLKAVLGERHREVLSTPWGVLAYLRRRELSPSDQEATRVARLLASKKQNWRRAELDTLREVMMPYLWHVRLNMILRDEFGVPFLDWDVFDGFYHSTYHNFIGSIDPEVTGSHNQQKWLRRLFSIDLPKLASRSWRHALSVIKHPHVDDFRAHVREAVESGESVDPEQCQRVVHLAGLATAKAERVSRRIGFIGTALSWAPVVGTAAGFLQHGVSEVVTNRIKRPYRWLYCLQDAARESLL